jgi:hypothetical protein
LARRVAAPRRAAKEKTDSLIIRNQVFEAECRAVLNGVRNEDELIRAVSQQFSFRGTAQYH